MHLLFGNCNLDQARCYLALYNHALLSFLVLNIDVCAAKNGIYINLVKDVRQAFESSSLVKINCQGMHATDYKKLGAKLKVFVSHFSFLNPMTMGKIFQCLRFVIYTYINRERLIFYLEGPLYTSIA